ncbi:MULTISPECIES: contact-dependent growth inhibition system immunity protein [unclassified Pantoea]|uniref:contact-dependent growth inhibition system immunity protein n=1 Tax=unclassified Pantoea TaxID=2630326 RepID=UPI00247773C2|nr:MULTISPECIES: contact-dependent growth inhibition system immunity protein [unclassified Pantoea]GME43451.1 contact-dependent growth inhibition system immunity protein [Pantoea sp. QMID1]GME43518.1 contact-dependent growth inhibition system immunity protein [Pantoea sp. QMID3]GME58306.1 contact-dependent growth inhibition system immunity protein [Pantoea sp. QMID4]GME59715.1 contact-dependent growth inhibition system immunity protein [Pantoea sp. QMID2]
MNKNYKNIGTLIRVFFGQDYDLFGETVEEVLNSYLETENPKTAEKVCHEAEYLLSLNDQELIEAFQSISQGEFNPEPWGETVRTFLEKIKNHLRIRL